MKHKKILITGSAGLIGSEAVSYFVDKGFEVHGIDNNLRSYFFGVDGDTTWNRKRLEKSFSLYHHHNFDVRDERKTTDLFKSVHFDMIIHAAAQPSHDWAAREPLTDFSINAVATLLLLESTRKYAKDAVFIFTSTNKVYGDNPNKLPLVELEKRFELPKNHKYYNGIDETMSLDQTTHSIFGVSKCSADLMVQEYGKYFGMNTVVFRGGCLTGPNHSAAKLHGFLAYLIKCIREGIPYTVIGYKGKQVRDNIHSHDLIRAFFEVYKKPKKGEVYNIGGSRFSNISIKEAVAKIEVILGKKAKLKYASLPRKGDHIWYISDVSKFKRDYPRWDFEYSIDRIIEDITHPPK
ncbi:MAG TPA: NAD-dependent epimerase/dehydratase family protein [Patescibacteria group bacterium]|nr:NAD-dependent epimerase/dehydratase family protein [Patescibacteria group bacterium]